MEDRRYELVSSKIKLCEGIDLNEDYNLPDYINDIKKLVRCDCSQVLHNAFDKGNSMLCEGEVLYSFLCVCEDNSLKNIIFSTSFSVNIPSKLQNSEDVYIYCKAENPQARLTSPRKVNLKSRLNIYQNEKERIDTEPKLNDIDVIDINKKCSNIQSMSCDIKRELNLHASHDIEISASRPEIVNIVYCTVNTYVNEIKTVESKISIRGESTAKIMYEAANGEYICICESFNFSEFLDNDYPELSVCSCEVATKDIKVSVQNNSFGEMRIIELDYSYDIEHKHFYNKETEILCDVYATDRELISEVKELEYNRFIEAFSSALSIAEQREIPDYNEYMPYEVVEANVITDSNELMIDEEKNKYVVCGNLKWNILCKCAENEKYYPFTLSLPFKYEKDYRVKCRELYEEHYIKIIKCSAEINKDKISLNAELYINCTIASKETDKTICNITISDKIPVKRAPVTLYYPKNGDSLWDIAKRYKSRCEDIIKANNLENDDISRVKVLLIPKK